MRRRIYQQTDSCSIRARWRCIQGILFSVSVFASDFDANLLLSGYTFRHSECVNSSLIMSNYFLEWKEFHCCRSSESEVCSFTLWISCVFPTAVNSSTGCWPRMCECENQLPSNSRAASTATGVSSFQFPVSSTVSRQQCRSRQWSEWSFPTCATLSRRRPPPATALSCSPATATRSKLSFYPTWRPIYRFGCQYKRLSRLSWLADEDDNLVPTDNVNRAMAPNSWQIEDDQI